MTVFTLRHDKKILKRNTFIYLGVSVFIMIVGFVYEANAHGVFSAFMMFGFVVPLVLGFIPYLLMWLLLKDNHPSEMVSNLYNAGVATLTVASLFNGVLDIYGTTRYVHIGILSASGILLILSGIVLYIVLLVKNKKKD